MAEVAGSSSEPPKSGDLSDFAKRLAGFEETPLLSESGSSSQTYSPIYLTRLQKFSFGLGHVINDIMGVLWFSYGLTFLQIVVHLKPAVSASLIFFGKWKTLCKYVPPPISTSIKITPNNKNKANQKSVKTNKIGYKNF